MPAENALASVMRITCSGLQPSGGALDSPSRTAFRNGWEDAIAAATLSVVAPGLANASAITDSNRFGSTLMLWPLLRLPQPVSARLARTSRDNISDARFAANGFVHEHPRR